LAFNTDQERKYEIGRDYVLPEMGFGECVAKEGVIPGVQIGDILFMDVYFEENHRQLTKSYNKYAE
jgi:hypothetical protein